MENENLETQTDLDQDGTDVNQTDANADAGSAADGAGAEQDGEGQKVDENADTEIYGAPESYDYKEVMLPEGMTLDQEILDEFNPIAKKFNLSQKSTNELMGLAVKLVQKQATGLVNGIKEAQQAETAQYQQLLENDKEIGENQEARNAYLDTADIGYNAIANENVKTVLTQKGLDYHPDIIKMFHKIGQLCKDDQLPDVNMPAAKSENPADVLYGSKT